MDEILTNQIFKNAGIPIISIILTIALKLCSKREMKFETQDLAIGLELFVTTVALLLVKMIELGFEYEQLDFTVAVGTSPQEALNQLQMSYAELRVINKQITEGTVYLFGLMVAIFATAMVIRGRGWENASRLNKFGIYFPTVLAIALLCIVSVWVK